MDAILVARRLKEARGKRTQGEVAVALGLSTSAVAMYECGDRIPRDEIKERYAKYYGTTVGALFFGEEVHN